MRGNPQQNVEREPKQLLDIREAASMLGICTRTMYRLIAAGELPGPVKVGRATRMVRTELDEYIERLKADRQRTGREPA